MLSMMHLSATAAFTCAYSRRFIAVELQPTFVRRSCRCGGAYAARAMLHSNRPQHPLPARETLEAMSVGPAPAKRSQAASRTLLHCYGSAAFTIT